MRISFVCKVVNVIEPVVPSEVVFKGNAEFYLATVVQKFDNQVLVIEIEASP